MHENHRQRVRERYFAGGFENMDDTAVLEMLLFYCIPRKDTNATARLLIERFGSLSGVLEASPNVLRKVEGIGDSTAAFLTLLPKVCNKYLSGSVLKTSVYLNDGDSVADYIRNRYIGIKTELFMLLCFDGAGRLANSYEVAGSIDSVAAELNDIVRFSTENSAKTVIIAHNHPEGVASPSKDDVTATVRIAEELKKFNINTADHFIIAADNILSMAATERFHSIF